MEKALKYERQLNWVMSGMIAIFACSLVYSMSQGWDVIHLATGLGFGGGIYGFSHRVIKELKRENESLKSGGSADTTDPTPPEDPQ